MPQVWLGDPPDRPAPAIDALVSRLPVVKAFHAIVSGRVQGVAFRWSTMREATRLGVVGTVSNLADGTVEVYAEGGDDALRSLAAWLDVGPSAATVERLDIVATEPTGAWSRFEIR